MVRPLNLARIGDRLEILRHAEIVRALDHRADHDAGPAGLARHLHHGGVADREVGGAAEHGREGLGVAARGGDDHLQAVLLEDAGVHADIEVDVAEIVHSLAEADLLEVGGRSWICDAYGKPHRPYGKEAAEPPLELVQAEHAAISSDNAPLGAVLGDRAIPCRR